MAKQSGLGDNLYVQGVDLSGDIGSLSNIHGGNSPIDVTAINKSGFERLGGQRDGGMQFVSYFNDSAASAFQTLKTLPRTDVIMSYFRGQALGGPVAALNAKQLNYDPTRDQGGSLTLVTEGQANGFGLEWGLQLTPGVKTDVSAANGTGVDTGGSLSFGGQAYLHVFAVVGTSLTVKIQDSADNVTFADVTGFTFTVVAAGAVAAERLSLSNTATIRQYVRAISTGTFSAAKFAVQLSKNPTAGQVF